MKRTLDPRLPRYNQLLAPTFQALKDLGGSGSNDEILAQLIFSLNIPDDVVDILHTGSTVMTELSYQAAWARTILKSQGIIINHTRSVWTITPEYSQQSTIDHKTVMKGWSAFKSRSRQDTPDAAVIAEPLQTQEPDTEEPWRAQLATVLQNMNPYAFERLAQRLLRTYGLDPVHVTKKSGDGGIDGTGQLKINGVFSFNVAFQCKRFKDMVGAPVIRDFRGSLTTDIEKAFVITTGTFTKAAREEARTPGKLQIDLIDGNDLINKLIEQGIGVEAKTIYTVNEAFFNTI